MTKFHVYLDEYKQGPFEIQALLALPGFSRDTLVCCLGDETWLPAGLFPDVRECLDHLKQAVKNTDIPMTTIYSTPPAPAVDPDQKTLRSGFLASFDTEIVRASQRSRLERFLSFWTQGRKGVLVVLSMLSVGLNYPNLDTYFDVYVGLAWPPPSPVQFQGSRIRHAGKVHPWRPWSHKPSVSKVAILDSQDLAAGLISLTVVVTSHERGVTTHKTLTYRLRQHRKRRVS